MFAWPLSTLVDRPVPKSKILENTSVSRHLKALLTDQIREIRWLAKLAPETLKLPSTPQVQEIAVFRISLKGDGLDPALLDLLDKAMAPPILFMLHRPDGKVSYSAAFKRPSEADSHQWVIAQRHATPFVEPDPGLPPVPASIDLGHLYAALLAPLLPLQARKGEPLAGQVARCEKFLILRKKLEQLTAKMHREKQFNRKVALNQELKPLEAELLALSSS